MVHHCNYPFAIHLVTIISLGLLCPIIVEGSVNSGNSINRRSRRLRKEDPYRLFNESLSLMISDDTEIDHPPLNASDSSNASTSQAIIDDKRLDRNNSSVATNTNNMEGILEVLWTDSMMIGTPTINQHDLANTTDNQVNNTTTNNNNTIDQIGNNGRPSTVFPLANCKGDCDNDLECSVGLICLQREGNETIPGCMGDAEFSIDYCIKSELQPDPTNKPTLMPATYAPTVTTATTDKPSTSPSSSSSPFSSGNGEEREAEDEQIEIKTFTSTFNSDTTYAGNMFDIIATSNIAITSMGINAYVPSLIVQVYTKIGSYKGYENDVSGWKFVGSATISKTQGLDRVTMIDEAFNKLDPIIVRRGASQSFYITTDGPYIRSTKGVFSTTGNEIYTNLKNETDIQFFVGVGNRYPMANGIFESRIWNGLIQYHNLDQEEEVLVSSTDVTFRRGDLSVNVPELGIKMSQGLSVKVLARANQPIQYGNGALSTIPFHSMADGATVLPTDDEGSYAYVSNSEMKQKMGGVYALYFNKYGNVVNYKQLLSGTTRNCSGGRTPWNTWLSCEEYGRGQCWQVDPNNERPPQVTKIGGPTGGNYESVAVDSRRKRQPIFYVTEDSEFGALRRYIPPYSTKSKPPYTDWDTIHDEGGTTRYLIFYDDFKFGWTTDEEAARNSQATYYPNVEGIDFDEANGSLYFVSKRLSMLFVLNLESRTYTASSTKHGALMGSGEFRHSPDQIVRNGNGEYLYVTEDGGSTVGGYAIHRPTGKRYAIFEANETMYNGDETTGLAFSPDGNIMYAAFQDCGCSVESSNGGLDPTCGCLFEFRREDGRSFDGATLSL